jgi:sulfur carrier protein ThiS
MKRVKVVAVGMLKRYLSETVTANPGQTVHQLLDGLGIPPDLVAVVMVNGRQEPKSYLLQEGDQVKLVPLVGGGQTLAKEKMLA